MEKKEKRRLIRIRWREGTQEGETGEQEKRDEGDKNNKIKSQCKNPG